MNFSRRQILRGAAGASLALPFMPSLLGKEALAKTPARPPRLLWLTTDHGAAFEGAMFPGNSPLTMQATVVPGHSVGAGPLVSSVQNGARSVSPILSAPSTDFTASLAQKMNVLRGLDVPWYLAHHTGGHMGNFAANDGGGADGVAVQAFPRPTIDQIIGRSPNFYPNLASVKQRVMVMGPRAISWNWSNPAARSGSIDAQKGETSSLNLFRSIFVPPTKPSRAPIADQVLQSYKSLREGNRRLSSADRQRLDDHIANMSELERKLNATANCGAITPPTDDASGHQTLQQADFIAWSNLFADVAIAAFSCGTSRIGVLGMGYYQSEEALGQYSGDWHQGVAHQASSNQPLLTRAYQTFFARVFLRVASKLEGMSNGVGGTLLDDTLMVWSQECGVSTHDSFSLPVVTFGSAAGALKTGLYCDYRRVNPAWVWLFSDGTMHSRIDHLTLRSRDLGAGSGSGILPSS
ncbi:MAG: DUF1552 domain-containing protein [Polyangiaceae bacterium]|nr:DUF1552 domain-containing protein [Polyangiaceae bacterium]